MCIIRQAVTGDVETICSIARETWWEAYSPILDEEQIQYMLDTIYTPETLTSQIKDNIQTYLLLIEHEKPVAFAAYSPRSENREIYKLHKLYCLPETQGRGFGKMLIDEVINRTLGAGVSILELNVNRHNKARKFYLLMGFEIIYEEDIAIGGYWMNDYVMRKVL